MAKRAQRISVDGVFVDMSELKYFDGTIVVPVDLQRYSPWWDCLPKDPHIVIARIQPEVLLIEKEWLLNSLKREAAFQFCLLQNLSILPLSRRGLPSRCVT